MPVATNLGNAKKALSASLTQLGGLPTIDQALDINVQYLKAAVDGAASTATADLVVWVNPYDFPVYVVSAYALAAAGLTADNTNFATITFKTSDALAAGATAIALTLATTLTDSGTWAANVPEPFLTVTKANVAIPAGGGLWFNIAKSGTGVVVPISQFVVRLSKAES